MIVDTSFENLRNELGNEAYPAFLLDREFNAVAANGIFRDCFPALYGDGTGTTLVDALDREAIRSLHRVMVFGARQSITLEYGGTTISFALRRAGTLSCTPHIVAKASEVPAIAIPVPAMETTGEIVSEVSVTDLSTIVAHMNTGAILLDSETRILAINNALYDVWRIDRDALKAGDFFADFMSAGRGEREEAASDEMWDKHVEAVASSVRSGKVPMREICLRHGRVVRASGTMLDEGRSLMTFDDVSLRDHSIQSIAGNDCGKVRTPDADRSG
jgi:PAS domain-containing protein